MSFPCNACGPAAPKKPEVACKVETRLGVCTKRFGYISCASAVDPFSLIGQDEAAVYSALNTMLAVYPNVIGYTGLLSGVEFVDPQSLVENTADCNPGTETVGARDITFNDYNGYDVDGSGTATPYWEYDMYDTLNKNGSNYVYFHVDCNNDLWLYYKEVNGEYYPLGSSFYAYKTMEKTTLGNSTVCKQVIRAKISFIGDPINLAVKPLVNLNNATGLLADLT